jgi:signal transduction histidine kinase
LIKRVFEAKGIPPEKLFEMASSGAPGVGIRGMRERIHQLGGSLEISSDGNGNGTIVVVTLPVDERRQPGQANDADDLYSYGEYSGAER